MYEELLPNGGQVMYGFSPRDMILVQVQVLSLLVQLKEKVLTMPTGATPEQVREHFASIRDDLMALNKCPDFVVNRGHYFGTAKFNDTAGLTEDEKAYGTEPVLSDADKRALIEFLKTF